MLNNYRRMALRPAVYQGHGRRRNYFEGWYVKIVDPPNTLALALIPGVSMAPNGDRHAFLQILDGVKAESRYLRFDFADFRAEPDRFAVQLADNFFSRERTVVSVAGLEVILTNEVPKPWPRRWYAPGVMGPFGFVPGMQCYHGLVSLHHRPVGTINGITLSKEAIGYCEKDWGSSFPNAWVWTQTNHLDHPRPSSLMISVADIPWLGSSFVGFLGTFLFDGRLHTFATWTGAKVSLRIDDGTVEITLQDRRRKLIVTGRPGPGSNLASPIAGAMTGKINESLTAELDVTFYEGDTLRYRGKAAWAGLEVTDNAGELLAARVR